MLDRIVVTYSSRTGVTREIAERIGNVIRRGGLDVTVCEAHEPTDINGYDYVIIGSTIYGGALREGVLTFIEAHGMDFVGRRAAIFTVGMLPALDPAVAYGEHDGAVELAKMQAPVFRPIFHGIFAGAYDPKKVDFVSRKLMEQKNALIGDYRDWDKIERWASSLIDRRAA
jgi:menaquinone-dependent protoporphyrinogen oxidase